jgi:hypothetical protein
MNTRTGSASLLASARPGTGIVLPAAYRVLPATVPFHVPGFERQRNPAGVVFAPEPVDCREWFERFTTRVLHAIGSTYLPVCRMSDGEFLLLFGFQPPSVRLPMGRRAWIRCLQAREMIRHRIGGFRAETAPGVSSGAMSHAERLIHAPVLSKQYADIANEGILGLHLIYATNPFQEQYFPAVRKWLAEHAVRLTLDNYVPFYFVYALLRGPAFPSLIAGRRVLVVHSATGDKREAITRSINETRPRAVEWLSISPSRSFTDTLDLSRLYDKPDVCLLGGGVGKAHLFPQFRPLGIPCIDAGFAFEVWADPEKQWNRPYMTPDSGFDASRVRFG